MTEKTLGVSGMDDLRAKVSDVETVNNPGVWEIVCKASSQAEGWMKSTKRMAVDGGYLYQVTTHQRNHDGTNAVAEALEFVPNIVEARF